MGATLRFGSISDFASNFAFCSVGQPFLWMLGACWERNMSACGDVGAMLGWPDWPNELAKAKK